MELTVVQIRKYYRMQDKTWVDGAIYSQLKIFQIEMKKRRKIPQEIVDKYKDTVSFMVEMDNT
jgi:hypothetical protein